MSKVKMPLSHLQANPLYKRIEQPAVVYHMTPRKNLDSILSDGKIKTGTDFVCFFFPAVEEIPVYIKVTGALHGRQYWDFDGRIKTAPPLIPEEQVVLKLLPRYSEPLYWYQEDTLEMLLQQARQENWTQERIEKSVQNQKAFDKARVLHYGDMKFKQNNIQVLELSEILNTYKMD